MAASPSQVQAFLDCPRKWGWMYWQKVPRSPETKSQALGTKVHSILESYLLAGTVPAISSDDDFEREAAKIAQSGIDAGIMPAPMQKGLVVEGGFSFISPRGVHWIGYKDYTLPGLVGDHKTTSNISYAKSETQLKQDIQAIVYAYEYMAVHQVVEVSIQWNYMQTRGAKRAEKRSLQLVSDHVLPIMVAADNLFSTLSLLLATTPNVKSLPFDAGHCDKYNGCQYQGLCNLSPSEYATRNDMNDFEGLLAQLNQRTTQIQAINPPESILPPAPIPEETKAAEPPKKGGRKPKEPVKVQDPPTVVEPNDVTTRGTFQLYINCAPQKSEAMMAEDLYAAANARILKAQGLSDYRFADFGKGPGIFRQTINEMIDEGYLNGASLVIRTGTDEASTVVSTLAARAALVVR